MKSQMTFLQKIKNILKNFFNFLKFFLRFFVCRQKNVESLLLPGMENSSSHSQYFKNLQVGKIVGATESYFLQQECSLPVVRFIRPFRKIQG